MFGGSQMTEDSLLWFPTYWALMISGGIVRLGFFQWQKLLNKSQIFRNSESKSFHFFVINYSGFSMPSQLKEIFKKIYSNFINRLKKFEVQNRVTTCPELCGTVPQMRLCVLRPAHVSLRTHLSCISKIRILK
jgi:hypothetical protein